MNAYVMAPEDYRAELARLGLPHYIAAARVGLHPSRLSAVLWGREKMSPGLAQRLLQVIESERQARELAAK